MPTTMVMMADVADIGGGHDVSVVMLAVGC